MSGLLFLNSAHNTFRAIGRISAALLLFSLFTHLGFSQNHQELQTSISSGNDALSEAVYGLHTTAYIQSGILNIAGDGAAVTLDISAFEFANADFSDERLNAVNTVIIRFENPAQAGSMIDAANLSTLENLANVVLLFTYDIASTDAASLGIGSLPSGANSFYSVSIPE